MSRRGRAYALNVRGNIAMAASIALAGFLALALAAAGRWTPLHTWIAGMLTATSATTLACYTLAWWRDTQDSPRGDSPEVTHHSVAPSLTPLEVRK